MQGRIAFLLVRMEKPYFKKSREYITIDNTCHVGGFWKKFDKNGERIGTFDKDLEIMVGD